MTYFPSILLEIADRNPDIRDGLSLENKIDSAGSHISCRWILPLSTTKPEWQFPELSPVFLCGKNRKWCRFPTTRNSSLGLLMLSLLYSFPTAPMDILRLWRVWYSSWRLTVERRYLVLPYFFKFSLAHPVTVKHYTLGIHFAHLLEVL